MRVSRSAGKLEPMNCQTFRRQLPGLLNQAIDLRTRTALGLHQELCADCRRLREVRQSIRNIVRAAHVDARPRFRPGA